MDRECWNCRFWQNKAVLEEATRSGDGECRARSPLNGERGFGSWPTTHGDSWCGEFQVRGRVPTTVTLECYQAAQETIRQLTDASVQLINIRRQLEKELVETQEELARMPSPVAYEQLAREVQRLKQVELAGV